MPPQPLTKAEQELLTALAKLNQSPGTMLTKQALGKRWCDSSAGRGEADLERAIQELVSKGLLRENALKTTVGFTSAGFAQAIH